VLRKQRSKEQGAPVRRTDYNIRNMYYIIDATHLKPAAICHVFNFRDAPYLKATTIVIRLPARYNGTALVIVGVQAIRAVLPLGRSKKTA
jgi:hypothetical protein